VVWRCNNSPAQSLIEPSICIESKWIVDYTPVITRSHKLPETARGSQRYLCNGDFTQGTAERLVPKSLAYGVISHTVPRQPVPPRCVVPYGTHSLRGLLGNRWLSMAAFALVDEADGS
jgi:hypothetical protein